MGTFGKLLDNFWYFWLLLGDFGYFLVPILATKWRYLNWLVVFNFFATFFQLFFLLFFKLFFKFFQHFSTFLFKKCSTFFQLFLNLFLNFFLIFLNFSTCQVASLALVLILATRWRYLNCLSTWPPDGTTCISCRFGQQLALLELVTSLVTKWCHLH